MSNILNAYDPYSVVIRRVMTEKANMLNNLQNAENNKSIRACKTPKYVFQVATSATKQDIKRAVEAIYKDNQITVLAVNTVNVKSKPKRARSRRPGRTAAFKKAIVTCAAGNTIDAA